MDFEPEVEQEEGSSFWAKFRDNVIELIEFIAIIGAVLIVIRFFVAEPHKVSGRSMVPNFQDGDYLITNKIGLRLADPQRGEVIILQNPRNTDQVFIKRVIGLPGERIQVENGKVYINDALLSEPYLPVGTPTQGGAFLNEGETITIPAGQYFVMGDNRTGSSDSREWGLVGRNLIIGQALLRYWPPQQFKLIQIDQSSD
ncbi:MAG: signal peptidase I [Patescibacteria group bacterium]|nr:signal peptidase I [Patescibacteria group bacterium]